MAVLFEMLYIKQELPKYEKTKQFKNLCKQYNTNIEHNNI
jgi:hypothetical protein